MHRVYRIGNDDVARIITGKHFIGNVRKIAGRHRRAIILSKEIKRNYLAKV
jgi:hypothetical protein